MPNVRHIFSRYPEPSKKSMCSELTYHDKVIFAICSFKDIQFSGLTCFIHFDHATCPHSKQFLFLISPALNFTIWNCLHTTALLLNKSPFHLSIWQICHPSRHSKILPLLKSISYLLKQLIHLYEVAFNVYPHSVFFPHFISHYLFICFSFY